MVSTSTGKNLLLGEQILSIKSRPSFRWEAKMKIAELFPLEMYPYTLTDTVKILKFGTPQTIATIVLKLEKFDVTLH